MFAPVEASAPAPRPDWADGRSVVGFVGRLEPRKGVLDLLAANMALQSGAGAECVALFDTAAGEIDANEEHAFHCESKIWRMHALMLGRRRATKIFLEIFKNFFKTYHQIFVIICKIFDIFWI